MKISKAYYYYFCILLFMFQPVIEDYIVFFKYYDEIFVLVFFVFSMLELKITKNNMKILLCFLVLTIIGILGNFLSGVRQANSAIIQDFVSNGKIVFFVVAVDKIKLNDKQKDLLGDLLAYSIRTLFVVLFGCSLISQFFNIGMTTEVRYGIKSFKFLFPHPAGLNTYFYFYMIIHSVTLLKNSQLRKFSNIFTFIGLFAWIMTMRSRAITFAILYLALYIYIIYFRKKTQNLKFRWYHIIVVIVGGILLSWESIEKYFFENDKVARYLLSRTSFQIAKDKFPFGSGFATFGTEASKNYYSRIYYEYDLAQYWGLSPNKSTYITDQYWFGIIGQFGFIGTALMILIIIYMYRKILSFSRDNKALYIGVLTLIMTSIFASITAATFIQASIIPSIMLFYLLRKQPTS